MYNRGWFADVDPELDDSLTDYIWQPCLQLDGSVCHSFQVWFNSEEACLDYIRSEILGKGIPANDVCDACGSDVPEADLEWDEVYEMFVCVECQENPPE